MAQPIALEWFAIDFEGAGPVIVLLEKPDQRLASTGVFRSVESVDPFLALVRAFADGRYADDPDSARYRFVRLAEPLALPASPDPGHNGLVVAVQCGAPGTRRLVTQTFPNEQDAAEARRLIADFLRKLWGYAGPRTAQFQLRVAEAPVASRTSLALPGEPAPEDGGEYIDPFADDAETK